MMQATLHQLRVFQAVAHHGSFTRAAEELLITQPTVSSQIKQLSHHVGLPLFEQIGKQLYLTQAGEALLATCNDVFERLEQFEMTVADLQGIKRGRLRLGVVTTAKYFVPRVLGSFCQRYPDVDIALQVTNHQKLVRRMQENLDDLYILSQPPTDLDLNTHPVLENPLVVIAHRDHPLAKKSHIALKQLQNVPFIMRESGSGTRRAIQQLFNQYKINVQVRLELGSNEAIKQAIAGGLGISILSQHTLNTEGDRSELAILNVQHFPIQTHWYASYLRGKQLSVIAQTFLDYLLAESPKIALPDSLEQRRKSA
ncbi:LysR family transcriptional regulator [Spirulina subsalsa]|uniref:LysR family transcriptional regulator n=1 Tax=Spirulina subsalsa TaxID=54311 RepID=UPI0004753EA4